MKRVIIEDKMILECKSKDCGFSDFELKREAYSFDNIDTLSDKIREVFERHMECIRKENTTGVTKVEVEFITDTKKNIYGEQVYEYNIKGTRYAMAVLSLDCGHFMAFDEEVEHSVSIIAEKCKYQNWYRIESNVPYKDYKKAYRNYVKSKWILSILRKWNIPPSAAWVRFRKATDVDKKWNSAFIHDDDDFRTYLMYVSGPILGLCLVGGFVGDEKFTFSSSDYLDPYGSVLSALFTIDYPDRFNLSDLIDSYFKS